MRYEVLLGERTVAVEIDLDGRTTIVVEAVAAEVAPAGADAWHVRIGARLHEVHLLTRDPLRVQVGGWTTRAVVSDERSRAAGRDAGGRRGGRQELRAPMPGLVKRVHVAVGDRVERGAPLVTLEAMKMENELRAAADGTVSDVAVVAGAKVEGGALLVVTAEPGA